MRALLVAWDGAGNMPPQRALLRNLIRRGHDVHVLGWPSQREECERDGASFHALESVVHFPRSDRSQATERAWTIQNVVMAPGYGAEFHRLIARLEPQLLLVDFLLGSALAVAAGSGRASAALAHAQLSPVLGTPLSDYLERLDRILVLSCRALDPDGQFGANVRFATPVRADPAKRVFTANPARIVISLSTSFQDQVSLLQRLCDAAGGIDAQVLVTTGHALAPSEFRAGANTEVRQFAPHEDVLPGACLLVTHAGHGAVLAAATYGTPMLCLPMGRDQPFVAAQAKRLGIAHTANPDADVSGLKAAIQAALADTALKNAARAFAAQVAGEPGLDDAADDLETLVTMRAARSKPNRP